MQIYAYQPQTITPTANKVNQVHSSDLASKTSSVATNTNDHVTLSSEGKSLAAAATLPTTPETPYSGEKLEQYAEIKKTQMKYEVASDMVNIATGNNDGISAPTAAYLSKNEDAREATLQHQAMQQQYQNMQTYSEQTEQAENNWVV